MKLRRGLIVLIYIFVASACIVYSAPDSRAADEDPSGLVVVNSETLSVYSEMSETSPVVMTLEKGTAVSVMFEMERLDNEWCAVAVEGAAEPSGYALCEGLERKQRKLWLRAGESGKGTVVVGETTDVRLSGNHVLVPVTLGHAGRDVSAMLILDTGASGTAISTEIAAELGIDLDKAIRVRAMTLGGNTVEIKVVQIDHLTVGPYRRNDHIIGVYKQKGDPVEFDGVLGMDFLSSVSYKVDLKNKVIHWGQ